MIERKKASKWRKLRNIIGGLLRLKSQEAIKIISPDQIIEEINKVTQPRMPSLFMP